MERRSGAGGGLLLDLGPHLADQALTLFGKPQAVGADVERERDGEGALDSFTLRLRYPGFSVNLGANCLSSLSRPATICAAPKGTTGSGGWTRRKPRSGVTRIPKAGGSRSPPPTGAR